MTMEIASEARPRRRRIRLTLGVLLLAVAPAAIGLAWVTNAARAQRRAVATIKRLGGSYKYDYEFVGGDPSAKEIPKAHPPGPAWLRRLIGDEPFQNVVSVKLFGFKYRDEDFALFEDLPRLRLAWIYTMNQISNDGLAHLQHNRELRDLEIYCHRRIDDAGIAHFRNLTNLENLGLGGSSVSDTGLDHLLAMKRLRVLDIDETPVSNAGLVKLKSLPILKEVSVQNSRATQEGVDELRKSLPNITVILGAKPGSYGR